MLRIFKAKSAEQLSDEELLEQYRLSGQSHPLGVLYARYMPMVYGLCLQVLRDVQAAEDAVISVYEALAVQAARHEIRQFRGWLYVLARNHCLMQLRQRQRKPTDLMDPTEPLFWADESWSAESEDPRDDLDVLARCMEALSGMQRRCLHLFYYEDQSYQAISTQLGESLGMVRSHIQNGRRNLRKCMER